MDGSCPLLLPSFGEKDSSERETPYSSQKVGLYRPTSDAIDLGYHTLDNNVCRSTSSSAVISVPIRQQILLQQKCIYVVDLCQLDDTLLLKIFSWLGTRDLCSVAQTCRRLWEIAWHPSLWKEVEIRYPQNATAALNALTRRGCHTYIRRLMLEGAVGLAGIFAQLSFLSFNFISSTTFPTCIRHKCDSYLRFDTIAD